MLLMNLVGTLECEQLGVNSVWLKNFVMKQAQLTTELITKKQGMDLKEKIKLIFLTCLNREPSGEEMDASIQFLEESKEKKSEDFRLDGLVHSLFACLDFRYLN